MIDSKDISVVIQGVIDRKITPKAIKRLRHVFPGAEIVLVTYEGTNLYGLDYDKVVLVKDPGGYPYDSHPGTKINNVNRQIVTTWGGLKTATRFYAFKLRSDCILNGSKFLDFFDQFQTYDPDYRVFEHKILSCVFFARDPRTKSEVVFPFHPSDIAFFGLRSDLINLFDIPFMTQEESVAIHRPDLNLHQCRYVPEQYLWVNCLRKNGKNIDFVHQNDVRDHNIVDTEKYTVSNFIYLDYGQFNLIVPKKLRRFCSNQFESVITHIEWQRLYKQYLDNTLVVPDRDPMRDLIKRKIKMLGWCNRVTKYCTMLLIGKKFRRGVRERILQFLTQNVCLPK